MKSKYELKISCKCRIFVHFVNSRQHKYIRKQKCVFCGQDARYGRCIVYIPSYSYTGMESGDSRQFLSTKIAQSLFEVSQLESPDILKKKKKASIAKAE